MAIAYHVIQSLLTHLSCTTFLVVLVVSLFGLYLKRMFDTFAKLPPGPWGWPILGQVYSINKYFHQFLTDVNDKFGKIASLSMGEANVVVLADHKLIKKAFRSREFVARPKSELSQLLKGFGMINSEGDLWKSQRRFLLKQKLGMRNANWSGANGLDQLETIVQREVEENVHNFLVNMNESFDPAPLLNCAISNVICTMVMSTRFTPDDKEFRRFMDLFDEGFKLFHDTGAMTFLPILKYLPGTTTTCQKLRNNRKEMLGFVKRIIDEHRESLDPANPRDLVDNYLVKIDQLKAGEEDAEDIFHGFDPEEQLVQIVLDLFSAGVETLKSSMLWAITYMLHNPDKLERVREEMDRVVGESRLPRLADMEKMPYTRATLYETLRRSTVVPLATTHATERPVEFEGYTLPTNTHVIPNVYSVHMDPENFPEPLAFRPERFLSADETEVTKPEAFLAFGTGQRQCLGDKLAEKEFFLFFASLFHCFEVGVPEGAELPSLDGVAAVTLTPKDFKITVDTRRFKALVSIFQDGLKHPADPADRVSG